MKIAVFLPGWVGDVVMATPALRALRRRYPDAKLLGLGKPHLADVLDGTPWLNEYRPYNSGCWADGVASTTWHLRRQGIDLAVLLSNSFRSALTSWLGGCRRRIGFAMHGRSLLLTEAVPSVRDARGKRIPSPTLDAYNQLAQRAGCTQLDRRMELATTAADDAQAQCVLERSRLAESADFVCLNPGGAFGAAKHWPVEHFARVARELALRHRSGVLVLGGPSEIEMSRAIAEQANVPNVHSLANFVASPSTQGPLLSLGLVKALIRRSCLLITTDSGPRHFGTAFDRPTISLFGPTHIAWTETYHPLSLHLQKQVECGPCQLRVCPLDHRCMTLLSPADVLAAVEQLLPRGLTLRVG